MHAAMHLMLLHFYMWISECVRCEVTLVLSLTKAAFEDRH
jgi:hypothetical protein